MTEWPKTDIGDYGSLALMSWAHWLVAIGHSGFVKEMV